MTSQTQTPLSAMADKLISSLPPPLSDYASTIRTNLTQTFTRLTPQQYIRLIIVIGAYALLRPYLLKLGARFQTRDHERPIDMGELEVKNARGEVVRVPEDSEEDDSEEEGGDGGKGSGSAGASWGKKAKRRQRRMLRKIMEEKERREAETQEEMEDKDIEEFLVD